MPRKNKYLVLAKLYFQSQFEYRFDLLLARFRNMVGYATIFMIWSALYSSGQEEVQGYQQAALYSYTIFGSLFNAVTVSYWSRAIQGTISSGQLNFFLMKPINFFSYVFTQDLAEKIFDITFTLIELYIVYLLFKPKLEFSLTPTGLFALLLFIPLVTILYFLFSLTISFTTFWYYQNGGWGQRFLADVLQRFFSGSYFPLEFLPLFFSSILIYLPTSSFFYIPSQIFLNRLSLFEITIHLLLTVMWIVIFFFLNRWMWRKGIKNYGAFGG